MIFLNATSSEDSRFRPRFKAIGRRREKESSVTRVCNNVACLLKVRSDTFHLEGLLMSTVNPFTLRQTGKMESAAEYFQRARDEIVYSGVAGSETSCLGGLLMSADNPFTLRQDR